MHRPLVPLLFTAIFGASLLVGLAPNVAAETQLRFEDFQDETLNVAPTEDWYTWGDEGCGATLCGTRLLDGDRVWRASEDTSGSHLEFTDEFCPAPVADEQAGVPDSSLTLNFRMRTTALSTQPAIIGLGGYTNNPVTDGTTAQRGFYGLRIETTGAFTALGVVGSQSTTSAFSGIANWNGAQWYNITIANISCESSGEVADETNSFDITLYDETNDVSETKTITVAGTWNAPDNAPQRLSGQPQSNTASTTVSIDDLRILDSSTGTPGGRFCADPDEDNFGYDYVEGVVFDDNTPATISLDDAFVFEGDSDNSAYLGKGFATGTTALATRARIEADTEGATSVFRIAYTTGATTLSAGSSQDGTGQADNLAASNGQDGGNFDDHVQVYFQENGDAWRIQVYYNVNGAGLTQLGSTVNYGANPNTPTTFNFTVDSESTLITLAEDDGDVILFRNLPDGLQNVFWKDQWFIGKGTTASNAFTYLDDLEQSQDDDSTCIFDLSGTLVVTGSSGLEPGSNVINPPEEEDPVGGGAFDVSGNLPEGFTQAALEGFLGVLLMVAVGAGLFFILGKSPIGAGIGAFGGFFLAFFVGWFDLWIVIVLVVLAIAAVFLLKFRGSSA